MLFIVSGVLTAILELEQKWGFFSSITVTTVESGIWGGYL